MGTNFHFDREHESTLYHYSKFSSEHSSVSGLDLIHVYAFDHYLIHHPPIYIFDLVPCSILHPPLAHNTLRVTSEITKIYQMRKSPKSLLLLLYAASVLSLYLGFVAAKTRRYTFNVRPLVFFPAQLGLAIRLCFLLFMEE